MEDLSFRKTGRPRSCACGQCKKCKHADYMRAYYQGKSPEERYRLFVAGRDREREAARERARGGSEAKQASIRRSHLRNPDKIKANIAVHNAIARGKLFKKPCEVCGKERVEAHHPDYSKRLEVIWLCRKHHVEAHGRTVHMP